MRVFLKRLAGFVLPGGVVFGGLVFNRLFPGWAGYFEPVTEFPGFVLVGMPVLFMVFNCFLLLYFNSPRLFFMNFFLLLIYLYIHTELLVAGTGMARWLEVQKNGLELLPFFIPIPFIFLHLSGERGFFTLSGIFKLVLCLICLLAAPLTVLFAADQVPAFFNLVPRYGFWGVEISLILFLEFALLLAVLIFIREHSFYVHNQLFTFWIVFAAAFSLAIGDQTGGRQMSGGLLNHSLMYNIAAGLFTLRAVNYAWSKAYRDSLTQIRGRMSLDEKLEKLSGDYAIAMIDIDKFKDFNDTYGHDSGDVVLQVVADLIENHSSGYAYRFGGEEFTVVYPGKLYEEVEQELEELRKTVAGRRVGVTRKSKRATKVLKKKVTISIGLADSAGKFDTAQEVLNAADNALFKAKDEGRNRLCIK